jgi:DNA-binding MarR family transcriptional regulator
MNAPPRDADASHPSTLASELRAVIGKLKRRLHEQATGRDLTTSQESALLRLERDGPLTVTALAKAEGIRPQSMGATIASLDALGLVRGVPDPNDGRQTLLSLSDTCRQWIADTRMARQDWLSGVIRRTLAAKERQVLAEAIDLLKRLADG